MNIYMNHQRSNPGPPPLPPLSIDRIATSNTAYPSNTPSGGMTPASIKADGPKPTETSYHGWTWRLDVVQQPIRARMCGFGDKDRRPITPPPCVRLIVTDSTTGKEIDANTIETAYFVLTVDLWDEPGMKEVNLVKHSATSPSISTATQTSYPPPASALGPIPDPNWNPVMDTRAHTDRQGYYSPMYNNHRPSYPSPHHPHQYPPNPQFGGGYPQNQNYLPSVAYSQGSPYQQSPSPYSYPHHGQQSPMPHTPTSQYSSGGPLTPTGSIGAPPGATQPAMFTRNLIGSLSASAFRLNDPDDKVGIWFILQDLSVRTEGTFRLKMNFVNVGAFPDANLGPSIESNTNSDVKPIGLTNSTAPVLASCFSEPFQVFSAKKFPGVIESTTLSRCFAGQGIKIPIRKDGKANGARGSISTGGDGADDDDAYE